MTTAHPRDPRLRRAGAHARRDPLEAAVMLDRAVADMRAAALEPEPEPEAFDAGSVVEFAAAVGLPLEPWQRQVIEYTDRGQSLTDDPVRDLAADVVTAAQLGTVDPPITAAEFAAALEPGDVQFAADVAELEAIATAADREMFSSEHRRLTWRSRHDERSRLFGVRARLAGSAPITDRVWPTGPTIDQGAEGACVGCGVAHATNVLRLAAAFDRGGDLTMLGLDDAVHVYERAQELDPYPGEDYSGTSVLAGLQAAVEYGLIGGYLWAFGTRDVAQAVLQRGPVIVGVPWLSGMAETGEGGLVLVEGEDTGAGHVLTIVGIRKTGPAGQPGPYFVWQNSWGAGYGDGGLGYIHHRDLATLLRGVGEAAIPTRDAQAPTS